MSDQDSMVCLHIKSRLHCLKKQWTILIAALVLVQLIQHRSGFYPGFLWRGFTLLLKSREDWFRILKIKRMKKFILKYGDDNKKINRLLLSFKFKSLCQFMIETLQIYRRKCIHIKDGKNTPARIPSFNATSDVILLEKLPDHCLNTKKGK